jgi:hypothetical protein
MTTLTRERNGTIIGSGLLPGEELGTVPRPSTVAADAEGSEPVVEDTWESGLGPVTVHVLLNELGTIGSVAKTLQERWGALADAQRDELLQMIEDATDRGIDRLRTALTLAGP